MTKKKNTIPNLRNHHWRKVTVESKNVSKLLRNIPTGINIEINKQIYAGEKLVCDKIDIPQGNPRRNTKSRNETGQETDKETATTNERSWMRSTKGYSAIKDFKKISDKLVRQMEEINQNILAREERFKW